MGNIKTTPEEVARAKYLRHVKRDKKKQRKYLSKNKSVRAVSGGLPERGKLMSQEMELRHLELANRHIAEGQQRIAEQWARVAGLKRRGRDTTTSNELLKCPLRKRWN
jgi:hypothetical protein